ncbi:Hypothetical protein PHPALM_7451 [Phytophthora palmivora]|uniref:Eukaryotic/viral aspartic protease n=1 Tax=Phytophthora palmivora TaxID=4796 RepID=A0A2P4YCB7_9STRA|nr:Hypothetical protein PHPALM_7451 [Phytophthora palmivora]
MWDRDGNERESEESDEDDSAMVSAAATQRYDGVTPRPRVVKLLRGERLGWWSSQKFDRRVRMRALVMGAGRYCLTLEQTSRRTPAGTNRLISTGKDKVLTTHKALVKVTLGWEVVYEFEVWIMPHHAGVDLILGTDFMIPAGIRLDLYNSAAKLPDEGADRRLDTHHSDECQRQGDQGLLDQYMTNVGMVPSTLPGRNLATTWEATTRRYRDWQVLAYESAIDKDLLYKEQELYADWLSRQPPAVERKPYHWPKGVKERPPEENKRKQLTCAERWAAVDAEKKATDTPGVIAESKGIYSDDPDGLAELEGTNSAMGPPSECRTQRGVMKAGRDAESHLTQLDMSETCLEGQANSANEANEKLMNSKRPMTQ